jgi:hypothetical protein
VDDPEGGEATWDIFWTGSWSISSWLVVTGFLCWTPRCVSQLNFAECMCDCVPLKLQMWAGCGMRRRLCKYLPALWGCGWGFVWLCAVVAVVVVGFATARLGGDTSSRISVANAHARLSLSDAHCAMFGDGGHILRTVHCGVFADGGHSLWNTCGWSAGTATSLPECATFPITTSSPAKTAPLQTCCGSRRSCKRRRGSEKTMAATCTLRHLFCRPSAFCVLIKAFDCFSPHFVLCRFVCCFRELPCAFRSRPLHPLRNHASQHNRYRHCTMHTTFAWVARLHCTGTICLWKHSNGPGTRRATRARGS